jgi:4-hydroxybenzoate polyprenyltransferase
VPRSGAGERLAGWVRLTHPFPSILDGLVSGGVAVVAGAAPEWAIRIGVSMTFLQLGIGIVNDVVDAPLDAGRKPGKPIPAGLVAVAAARAAAIAAFGAGMLLALTVGAGLAILALVVIAIGLAYDLRFKGTEWSWLPFAIGIPILPVYGWFGATGTLPPAFAALIPAAIAAGAGLAIGNSLVDVERDVAAGATSVAARLGPDRAALVTAGLYAAVWVVGVVSAVLAGGAPAMLVALTGAGAVAVAAPLLARRRGSAERERAWQAEAIALAAFAVVWLLAVAG